MHSLPLQQALAAGRAFMRGQGNRMHAWLVQKSERGSRFCVLTSLFLASCAGWTAPLKPLDQELLAAVLREDLGVATRLLSAELGHFFDLDAPGFVYAQQGASPNTLAPSGNSILQTAVHGGHLEMVKLLLRHKGDVNLANPDGLTALYLAQKPAMQRTLLENGANPFIRSAKRNYSPFEFWSNTFAHVTTEAEKKQLMDVIEPAPYAEPRAF